MPQATDELRAKMQKYFADPIDDQGPLKYLFSRGYTDTNGVIRPPTIDHMMTEIESDCADFLFQEWDYAYDPNPKQG